MIGQAAAKTKFITTCTLYSWNYRCQRSAGYMTLYSIFTVRGWTPAQEIIVIHKCAVKKCSVFRHGFGIHQFLHGFFIDNDIAFILRALDPPTFAFILNFLLQIMDVACFAEAMTASNTDSFHVRIIVAANIAHKGFL